MCELATMITGGTALLSAAMGAAQQAVSVAQQLRQADSQRNDYNFLAAQQRNAAAVDEIQAQRAEQAGEANADAARQKAGQRLGQLQARLAAQGTDSVLRGRTNDTASSVHARCLSWRPKTGEEKSWARRSGLRHPTAGSSRHIWPCPRGCRRRP
ncbi:MAG: hypothetical protein PSV46_06480 [Reyranella sp.]|nr:hypothetical protein [Reyranella sp.]